MKVLFFSVVGLLMSLLTYAQEADKGIIFQTELSWNQVQDKAKAEGKYIFMDCNASWCAPCKEMEKSIFTQEKIGTYFNKGFISVKVQMDSSKNDNSNVQNWYKDAHNILSEYKITIYPTFLFFSPDGKLVHKSMGFQDAEKLLNVAAEAINPNKQYFTLRENYLNGKLEIKNMAYLAVTAKALGENDLAQKVAEEYISLMKTENLFTKENIEFLCNFTQSSKENGFKVLYQNQSRIDSVMGMPNYLQGLIDYIIAKEEIDPIIFRKNGSSSFKPDWPGLEKNIEKKYGKLCADRTITGAKIRWSAWKEDWEEHTKNLVIFVEKYNVDKSAFNLNNLAWTIFEHSNKKDELNAALSWSNHSLKLEPNAANWMDTNANLLYKLGRKQEAISQEEKAVKLEPGNEDFQVNLEKMKKGLSTWQ